MESSDLVTLALDETPINGYGLLVVCELSMPDADLSGQSSSTSVSEEGFKPKTINVTLSIHYKYPEQLQTLVQLAESLNGDGERVVYKILNQTATAYNVRQVRFTGRLRAQELADELAWRVSFSLIEQNSVPEKVESRLTDSSSGSSTQSPTESSTANTAQSEDSSLNGFEKVLGWADKQLAD